MTCPIRSRPASGRRKPAIDVKDFARDQGRLGLVSPNACGLSEAEQLDGIVDANTLAQARVGHDFTEQVDQRAAIKPQRLISMALPRGDGRCPSYALILLRFSACLYPIA